jgi:hypothetical protein
MPAFGDLIMSVLRRSERLFSFWIASYLERS